MHLFHNASACCPSRVRSDIKMQVQACNGLRSVTAFKGVQRERKAINRWLFTQVYFRKNSPSVLELFRRIEVRSLCSHLRKDVKIISYAIIRNENHKVNAVPLLERHNERCNKNYSNKDIDLSRSHLNYHLKQIQAESYLKEFDRIRTGQDLKGNLRLHGEKQSTILCEFIITSDKDFFDRLGTDKTKQFFEHAYDFVTAKVGGEQYVVSAVVHMDEATPHMHVSFIPVIQGKDRKGQPCKRINCSEFWKGRDSYARLQDEYYDYMANTCGYSLERGEKGISAEHLSVAELNLKRPRSSSTRQQSSFRK